MVNRNFHLDHQDSILQCDCCGAGGDFLGDWGDLILERLYSNAAPAANRKEDVPQIVIDELERCRVQAQAQQAQAQQAQAQAQQAQAQQAQQTQGGDDEAMRTATEQEQQPIVVVPPKSAEAAPNKVLEALRNHINNGLFSSDFRGGYLDILEVRHKIKFLI